MSKNLLKKAFFFFVFMCITITQAHALIINGRLMEDNSMVNGSYKYECEQGVIWVPESSNVAKTVEIIPKEGYYITKNDVKVESMQYGTNNYYETVPISGPDITFHNERGNSANYIFGEYNCYGEYLVITVNFQSVQDISGAEITLSQTEYIYDGTEKKPSVTEVLIQKKPLNANYYTVSYSNNINVGTATVKVTGNGIYKGTATTTFTISKATTGAGISWSSSSATATLGKSFTAPTLNNPHQLAVTYSSSKTDVATISADGAVTIKGVGETTIKATFAGNNTYDAAEVSYKLTVKKDSDTGLEFSSSSASATMGKSFTPPTLKNPHNLSVTYSSSRTSVATVDNSGKVTLVGAGETTIKASFAGNDTYSAAEASYVLTVSKNKDLGLAFSEATALATIDEDFTPPTLANPNQLPVTYSSSDTNVATVNDEGQITLVGPGVTTITANFAGNNIYEKGSVSYELTVKKNYGLWIGDTQVNSLNQNDVLGSKNTFFFDPSRNLLIITANKQSVTVESRLPELTIFLNGYSTLERVFYGGDAQGTLRIISYNNIPGELTLLTQHTDGVISGFSSLDIDKQSLTYLLTPAGGVYENGHLRRSAGGNVAGAAIIGQYIKPLVEGKTITFKKSDFTSGDKDVDLTNKTIKNILFTFDQSHAVPDENDGYDSEDNSVVLMSTISDTDAGKVAGDVAGDKYLPGSAEFAKNFVGGITFMVPDGEGTIEIDLMNDPGYTFHIIIGNSAPQTLSKTERGIAKISYQVDHPEYIFLYMTKDSGTRIGKREKVHGKVYSLSVHPAKSSTNPLGNVSGFPASSTPEVSLGAPDPTGIQAIEVEGTPTSNDPNADDDRWFTLSGQQISKPTQKGIYIHRGKKIVIK